MESIRAFIALPTDSSVRERIALTLKELQDVNADVRWENIEKLHITLKFLGNVEIEKFNHLSKVLEERLKRFPPFEIVYRHLGGFPSLEHPRVVWIGAEPSRTLGEIQRVVEETSYEFGFKKEDREFHPHMTIGRVRGTRNLRRLTDKLKSLTFEPIRSLCSGVLIMQSTLHPTGSTYAVKKAFTLT